jgi:hypothetical protein
MNATVKSLATFTTVKMQPLVFNGTTTTFTMTTVTGGVPNVLASSDLLVSLDGVIQQPDVAYTASGNQIIFTTAPLATSLCFIVWYEH